MNAHMNEVCGNNNIVNIQLHTLIILPVHKNMQNTHWQGMVTLSVTQCVLSISK